MPSTYFFLAGTLLLSLNFVRFAGLAVSDWFYFGALVFAVFETLGFERQNLSCWTRNRFLVPAGVILFGAIISTYRSRDWSVALVEIAQQIFVITLFVSLTWIMVRRGKGDAIVLAFIASGLFAAGIAMWDFLTGANLGPQFSGKPDIQLWGRYAGTLGHPNKLGYFLVITALLSLGRAMSIKSPRSSISLRLPIWVLAILIQLIGIYLSGSVTAYLGLALGVLAILLSSRVSVYRTLKALTPALVIATVAYTVGVTSGQLSTSNLPMMDGSLIGIGFNRAQDVTIMSRVVIYEQTWDRIVENPIVGVGYDQISTSDLAYYFRELTGSVHNALLEIWYVGGILAFLGWFFIYLSIGWGAIKLLRLGESSNVSPLILGSATAALAILFMDQFQDAIYQREKWLAFGLLVGWAWKYYDKLELTKSTP